MILIMQFTKILNNASDKKMTKYKKIYLSLKLIKYIIVQCFVNRI